MTYNILILDDEKEIADLVELYLKNENYNIYKFYNSKDALKCISEVKLDMAILDIMLPDIDGFSICNKIRENYTYPIIMLTAKVDDISKIKGLSIGADDYITKPFNPLELIARVKSALRRYHNYNKENENNDIIEFLGLSVNKKNHKCILYNEELNLTPIEFSILWYLCKNRGKVVSSEELFTNVWGEKYLDCNNTVMVHIKRLREKMHEKPKNPKFIKTIWGVGYEIEN
ncbi:MAG: VanR-ABDEGLN family response regulator transcription factor [Clostridia bacterium]|nr:VanR-ABDEGLN family response regulator transcription factor [Clostridia bacterium]